MRTESSTKSARFELAHAAQRAARLQVLVVAVECAAVGTFVAAVVFAAGIASGAEASARLVLLATTIAAAVAFLGWHERASSMALVVRRADRRAGLDGALCAVLQSARGPASAEQQSARGPASAELHRARGPASAEQQSARGPASAELQSARGPASADLRTARDSDISELLAARVRRRLGPADLLSAALPRTPLAVLAPLLAVALVALVLERGPSPQRVSLDPALAGSAAALRDEAARSRADGDERGADALEITARRVEAIAERGSREGADVADPTARRAAHAELRRSAQAPELAASARAALEDAADALDHVLDPDLGVPNRADAARGTPGKGTVGELVASRPGTGREPSGGAQDPGGTRPADETSGRDPLANEPGDGRMLGPPAGGESESRASDVPHRPFAGEGAGRGVVSARWWPSRYDAVVERYLTP